MREDGARYNRRNHSNLSRALVLAGCCRSRLLMMAASRSVTTG